MDQEGFLEEKDSKQALERAENVKEREVADS